MPAQLTLPDRADRPTGATKARSNAPIARHVSVQFGQPVAGARSRAARAAAPSVLVPEAAVDEHDAAPAREHQVGTAGEGGNVQAVSEPGTVQQPAHLKFGACVRGANCAHGPTTGLGDIARRCGPGSGSRASCPAKHAHRRKRREGLALLRSCDVPSANCLCGSGAHTVRLHECRR